MTARPMTGFSVVMSVYQGDVPAFFQRAVDSVLTQTCAPSELLIVVDGPVGRELESALGDISVHDVVRIIRVPRNNGAGASRRLSIAEAKYEIIAVMDADDICLPNRFERQLHILESNQADVVGAWIEEFESDPGDSCRVRMTPTNHEEIFKYGKWRQPLNHVTAMFRRDAYLKAGGYQPIRHVEDYDLIARMLWSGAKFHNIPEVLVCVRCGNGMLKRRGGMPYLASELRLFHRMYLLGYLNWLQLTGNVAIRLASRLLPDWLLGFVYCKWLRQDKRKAKRQA